MVHFSPANRKDRGFLVSWQRAYLYSPQKRMLNQSVGQ